MASPDPKPLDPSINEPPAYAKLVRFVFANHVRVSPAAVVAFVVMVYPFDQHNSVEHLAIVVLFLVAPLALVGASVQRWYRGHLRRVRFGYTYELYKRWHRRIANRGG